MNAITTSTNEPQLKKKQQVPLKHPYISTRLQVSRSRINNFRIYHRENFKSFILLENSKISLSNAKGWCRNEELNPPGFNQRHKQTNLMWFWPSSSLICGNKMPTRCNRGFHCRSYCLFNMFRAPLCPSSGAQEHYTVVAACGIWCCGFQVVGLVCSCGVCVRFVGCSFSMCVILLWIFFKLCFER